VEAH